MEAQNKTPSCNKENMLLWVKGLCGGRFKQGWSFDRIADGIVEFYGLEEPDVDL